MATYNENVLNLGDIFPRQPQAKLYELLQYWYTSVTEARVNRLVGVRAGTARKVWESVYGTDAYKLRKRQRYRESKLGDLNPSRQRVIPHAVSSDHKGYLTIVTPTWYSKDSRRIYFHHFIWASYHRLSRVPKGMVIHHLDGDKTNNSPLNLLLCTSSEHACIHREGLTTSATARRAKWLEAERIHRQRKMDDDIV